MSRRRPRARQSISTPGGRRFTGQEVGELLLRACHDLRAPLRAIRAHTELLVKTGDLAEPSGCDPRLAFIIEGAGRMNRLVDGLSSYAIALRISPESFVLSPLGVLLRTVLAKLDKERIDHRAEVTYGEMPAVPCDPDRIMELFEGLIHHRSRIAPRIHITTEPQGEGWLFTVRDDGPGLEAADLDLIFQPFARLHSVDRTDPGLGLAICREIVERHGGRIWAESQAGGCTFLFTLPAPPC